MNLDVASSWVITLSALSRSREVSLQEKGFTTWTDICVIRHVPFVIHGGAEKNGKRDSAHTTQRDGVYTIPVLRVLVGGEDPWNRGISDATMAL